MILNQTLNTLLNRNYLFASSRYGKFVGSLFFTGNTIRITSGHNFVLFNAITLEVVKQSVGPETDKMIEILSSGDLSTM